MSIIAGIYCRHKNQKIPDAICDELKVLVSRNLDDEISVFTNKRAYLVKLDVGAFGETGHYTDSENGFSILAGEPLISSGQTREADLIQIHEGITNKKFDILKHAQGVFCAADYQKETLTLVTDKLGIRPVYYWINEDYVIFAGALRILENLSVIPKKMNIRAVTEIAGLGHALGDKTPYKDIFLLKSGEILQVKNENVSFLKYWNWDQIDTSSESEEVLLQQLYNRFESGIIRRLRNDTTTVSFLSGGLDSRCIVGILSNLKAKVHTFNFARPNTQDQILGRDFAERVQVIHSEIPKDSGDHTPDYSAKMAEAWKFSKNRQAYPAERPSLIWSGEGGSVALGHVHLARKIVELMRAGKKDAAIKEFIEREHIYLSPKLFNRKVLKQLSEVIQKSISEELELINSKDPSRKFYLFLMLNDQRRKLANHFENIDLHRLEFQLPFFDSEFLETIISIPVEMCLEHKFYVKWLYLFPKSVTSVSWQAYPGHEPCPLPIPEGLSYQWDNKYQVNEQKSLRRKLVNQGKALLNAEDFPAEILSKNNIRLALWLHQTGWRDYSYIIENAETYYKYWRICHGEYSF